MPSQQQAGIASGKARRHLGKLAEKLLTSPTLTDAVKREIHGLPTSDEGFASQRLSRLRLQLTRLDGMIAKEKDPAKLDRLARAVGTLAEQEATLAGRSRRPEAPGRKSKAELRENSRTILGDDEE
jgi:hypothetical protein